MGQRQKLEPNTQNDLHPDFFQHRKEGENHLWADIFFKCSSLQPCLGCRCLWLCSCLQLRGWWLVLGSHLLCPHPLVCGDTVPGWLVPRATREPPLAHPACHRRFHSLARETSSSTCCSPQVVCFPFKRYRDLMRCKQTLLKSGVIGSRQPGLPSLPSGSV